jgi:WD40 repeat protein
MKTPLLKLVPLGLGILPIVGCVGFQSDESGMICSLDGRWIASYTTRYAGMGVPPEGEILGHKNVGIKIRAVNGSIEQSLHYDNSGKSYGAGISEVAWSPSGTLLAVNGSRGFEVFNRADGNRKSLTGPVKRFRWVSDSDLVYIWGNITVSRISVNGEEPQTILTRRLGVLDEWQNALSPDGGTVIFQQADHLFLVDLSNTNHARQVKVEGTLFECLWDSSGEQCLFKTLVSRSTPTNYYARPKVLSWLYEAASGGVMNLSERLPDLPGDEEFDGPLAFSANGRWVLLPSSGGWNTRQYRSRTWLVRVSPLALVDLSEAVGPSFSARSFSPQGDYMLLTKPNQRTEGRFDVFISRMGDLSTGTSPITQPRKVAEDQFRWVWYPDGKRLLVSDGLKYRTVVVEPPQ